MSSPNAPSAVGDIMQLDGDPRFLLRQDFGGQVGLGPREDDKRIPFPFPNNPL